MRIFSLTVLFCMTRRELFELHAETVRVVSSLPCGHAARSRLFQLLRDIRRVLGKMRV